MDKQNIQSVEEMEDKIVEKMVNDYTTAFGYWLIGFQELQKAGRDIKTFACHDKDLIAKRDLALNSPVQVIKNIITAIGGIPALVEFEQQGKGLLSNCIVLPLTKNENNDNSNEPQKKEN